MGGEPEGGSSAVLYVQWSNGNKFAVEVDLGATVLALKGLVVERAEIPTGSSD
jgi:ubiquilin